MQIFCTHADPELSDPQSGNNDDTRPIKTLTKLSGLAAGPFMQMGMAKEHNVHRQTLVVAWLSGLRRFLCELPNPHRISPRTLLPQASLPGKRPAWRAGGDRVVKSKPIFPQFSFFQAASMAATGPAHDTEPGTPAECLLLCYIVTIQILGQTFEEPDGIGDLQASCTMQFMLGSPASSEAAVAIPVAREVRWPSGIAHAR